jgi:hypothetical protein
MSEKRSKYIKVKDLTRAQVHAQQEALKILGMTADAQLKLDIAKRTYKLACRLAQLDFDDVRKNT